jgi:lysophospholipase L1-like esterase
VINKGVAGQQSFELLERFDADVVSLKPRAVIVWGFINDIFRAPPGAIEASLARVRNSYTELIQRARAHGIEPILATEVTIRPRSETIVERLTALAGSTLGREAYQDQINRHVLATNRWLIETAARERVLILHLQAVLAEPGGRRRTAFAQPDGSHITAAGYEMLTSYALPVLKEFIVDR